MATLRKLVISAGIDTSEIDRGVQRIIRDMERLRKAAAQTLGNVSIPDTSATATASATAAAKAYTSAFANAVDADRARIADSVTAAMEKAAADGAAAVQEAMNSAPPPPPPAASSGWAESARVEAEAATAALDELTESSRRVAEASTVVAASQAEIAGDVGMATGAYKRGEIGVDEYRAAMEIARTQADALGIGGGSALAREISKAEMAIVLASDATDEYADKIRKATVAGELQKNSTIAGAVAIQDARNQVNQVAIATDRAGEAATRSVGGWGRLNNSMVTIARQAANVHPAVGQLVDVLGTFALGTATMVAVLAGLAALATAWNRVTEESRKAAEEQKDALDRLAKAQDLLQLEDAGPGGQTVFDIEQVTVEIARVERELRAAEAAAEWLRGSQRLGAEEAVERLNDELTVLAGKRNSGREVVRRAEVEDAERRSRELDQEQRKVEELMQARLRMADTLRSATLTSFGIFDIGELTGDFGEAVQEAEALRGKLNALTGTISALRRAGGGVPSGALQLLDRLEDAVADADAEVRRRIESISASFEGLSQLELVPRVTNPILKLGVVVDSFSLENLERSFDGRIASIRENFVRGIIDEREMEEQGRIAAERFNTGLIETIDRLRSSGKLTEALELAAHVKLDGLDIDSDLQIFNDTIEAVRNVSAGFDEMANALGDISPVLSAALGAIDALANGIGQIKAGRAQGGAVGDLAQLSGALSIAAATIEFANAILGRSESEREGDRILQENNQRLDELRLALSASQFDASEAGRLQGALTDRNTRPIDTFFSFGGARERKASRDRIEEIIAAAGISLEDFDRIVKDSGITLYNDGILVDGALQQLREWLGLTVEALTGFRNTLADRQQERDIRDRILGVERDPSQQLDALFGDLASLAPGLFEKFFAGVDLSNSDAVRQAVLRMFDAFGDDGASFAEIMGSLSRDEFLDWIGRAADSLSTLDKVASEVAGALSNVPEGFRILNLELIRFNAAQATRADELLGGRGVPSPGPDPGTGGRPRPTYDSRSFVVNVYPSEGMDEETLADRVVEVIRRTDREDGLTYAGDPYAFGPA